MPPDLRRHALILASGPFGHAVADRLRSRELPELDEVTVQPADHGTHPSLWPRADLLVFATSHERPRVSEAIDEKAFIWRLPWLEICAEPTEVRVGPVVTPGRTACHRCFVNRRHQHRRSIFTPAAGDEHPTGFAAHHVGITAALARQAIAEALDGPAGGAIGGTVRRLNLVTGALGSSAVVAGDRCPRCRGTSDSEELWRELAEATRAATGRAGA
ncbi:hypothetical protein Skr01_21550 [Sphaerisporangium krabiense]|uniref:Bacteriocin biosynthesis cyclodehydratase domain-containing protein n=1 Tax=Sphaerisporangium krabiense TaxID=763782 RepID=A0A7W9DS07_9ACTN|nr:TOMM precursor leader peptide-binding protein [Sphaerisporangium krabiense]MBB5627910.1 bacteriocin biosynthesis cyclodehydratase domain-containing protein [Sphaerisporangium krabiense]GII62070.1 hypothetical protein Skr01_21550 [Sphaerisporangium krabiense]